MSNEKHLAVIKTKESSPPAVLRPESLDEFMRLAEALASSDLVPKDYKGKPANVLVAIQAGAEVGLHPMQAIQSIAVINGRPTMWGDAVLGLVMASGELEDIQETDDEQTQTATCAVKRKGIPSPVVRTFSQADAEKIMVSAWDDQEKKYVRSPLANKGVWAAGPKYRARMRQMRARSWALRDLFSDKLKGIIPAEEVEGHANEALDRRPEEPEIRASLMPRRVGEAPPLVSLPPKTTPIGAGQPSESGETAPGGLVGAAKPAADPWEEILDAMMGESPPTQEASVPAMPPTGEGSPRQEGSGVAPAAGGTRFEMNGKEVVTAGITKETLLKVYKMGAMVDELEGKGKAKDLLGWDFGVEHRTELTEPLGQKYLAALVKIVNRHGKR